MRLRPSTTAPNSSLSVSMASWVSGRLTSVFAMLALLPCVLGFLHVPVSTASLRFKSTAWANPLPLRGISESHALSLWESPAAGSRLSRGAKTRLRSTEESQEELSELLAAKNAINHLGDVENIAKFLEILKTAKMVLYQLLKRSNGLVDPMIQELISELEMVNVLSKPAEDAQLLSGTYTCESCFVPGKAWGQEVAAKEVWSIIPASDELAAESTITPASASVTFTAREPAPKPSKTMTCDVTVSLTVGASSVQAAGSAQNEGPFSLAMSFPDSDADSTTYKVAYLDQDLLILRGDAGAGTWVLRKHK